MGRSLSFLCAIGIVARI